MLWTVCAVGRASGRTEDRCRSVERAAAHCLTAFVWARSTAKIKAPTYDSTEPGERVCQRTRGRRSLRSWRVTGQLLSRGEGGAKLSRKRRSNSTAVRMRCCAPMEIAQTVDSLDGANARIGNRYQSTPIAFKTSTDLRWKQINSKRCSETAAPPAAQAPIPPLLTTDS